MTEIVMEGLSFAYGKGPVVLDGIDFSAQGNTSVGVIGANGAGKSTLLKLLVGLLSGYRGRLLVNGLEVKKGTLAAIRAKTGYVFQDSDSQLFLSTVYEDVAFAPRNYGCPEEEVHRRVMSALRRVGLEQMRDSQIYRMSGGQKKLASIATILSMEPDIILLDEPSAALDPRNRRNLIRVVNELPGLKIIASHDLDMILDTCERTVLLGGGRIVRDGESGEILTDEKLLSRNGLELPLSIMGRPEMKRRRI